MREPPSAGMPPEPQPAARALPALGDLAYQAQRFLLTDSKMSEILVVRDEAERELVFKIACTSQRSLAAANRQAIYNSVHWLEAVGPHPGIATLYPIQHRGRAASAAAPPTYVSTLSSCPGEPEFIVLDYMQGGTLSDFVRKRPLPLKVTLWLAHQLASTLAHLHERGCVHRDLKPENILFRTPPRKTHTLQELQPVLIDFGVAAGVGEEKFVCGSRLWMAPELQEAYEQILPIDPSWDIYALGLICCYMLSGLRPRRKAYTHEDHLDYQTAAYAHCDSELLEKQMAATPPLAAFKALIGDALAKTPSARPTAAAFAEQTAPFLAAAGSTFARSAPQPASQPPRTTVPHAVEVPTGQQEPLAAAAATPGGPRSSVAVQLPPAQISAWRRLASKRAVGLGLLLVALLALIQIVLGAVLNSNALQPLPAQSGAVNALRAEQPTVVQPSSALVRGDGVLPPTASLAGASSTQSNGSQGTDLVHTNPPPTLASISRNADAPVALPTLVATRVLSEPIPTLAALPERNAQPQQAPTLAPLPATSTTAPTATNLSTRAAATSRPTRATTNTPLAPVLPRVRLLSPPHDALSSEDRVDFVWESVGAAPSASHCFELVFWDPQKSNDKRSPVGAGRESRRTVNLRTLADGAEPLLRNLARSDRGFAWGVRLVNCAAPRTVLQDVEEIRLYRYQP